LAYDLVIRSGMVIDGTGMDAFVADIGVEGNRIAKIGCISEHGREEIDAEGHIVTPGFIDGHTHMDAQIHWDPLGTCSSWNGVTTVVMGNCGFTIAPSSAEDACLVIRNLERAEDISPVAMAQGIEWNWETFPEYMQTLDKLPKGINYATYIGHSALRTWAMGERAFEDQASEDDFARMEGQLRAAMKAGAIGFSTSRSSGHETSDNRLVASRVASWQEVRRLVCTMGKMGGGIFEIAKERESNSSDPAIRGDFINRMVDLAVESGALTTFGILTMRDRAAWRDHLAMLDRTAARGGRMLGQTHTRGVCVLTSFLTYMPFDRLGEWKDMRSKPLDEQKAMLRNPEIRSHLVHAAKHGDYGRAIGTEAPKPNWDRMTVYNDTVSINPTVSDMATQRGVDPVDLVIDLSLEKDFKQFFSEPVGTAMMEPDDLLEVMRHPRTVMTFSDSGAHVSQIADSSIQVHLLAYWVRERQSFTLEEAVRMITLGPARVWGFHDRGLLREGMKADINVIDFAKLAPELPRLVHDLPGGARRLIQKSRGIRATVVNGKILFRDQVHTGVLPGHLLRGPQSS
jgi:N-acyl-D-amino-acid deacylase